MGKDQRNLLGKFRALFIAQAAQISLNKCHDRRPIVAVARNSFAHPTIQQTDELVRHHVRVFKIEEQFKIKDPS
jgi:hypothetical protein